MSYLLETDRLEAAKELLLNPVHRESRLRTIKLAILHGKPANPFKRQAAPLNYLVQVGRESPATLKEILEESEKVFKASQPDARKLVSERRELVRNSVAIYRERLQLIRKYESMKQGTLISYKEATILVQKYTVEWEAECKVLFLSQEPSKTYTAFRKEFFEEKEKQLEAELKQGTNDEKRKVERTAT